MKKRIFSLLTPLLLISCAGGSVISEELSSNSSFASQEMSEEISSYSSEEEIESSDVSFDSKSEENLSSEEIKSSDKSEDVELSEEKISSILSSSSEVNIVTKKVIYVSPNGNDNNPGSEDSPYLSLSKAVSQATKGTTIYLENGVYPCSERINLTQSGTEDEPITITAKNVGEKVELNFTNQPYGHNNSSYVGVYLKGNYWNLIGLTIAHAGDNGIKVEGSHNYIGRCITHHNGDTGIQLGFGHHDDNLNGELCSYNIIENCDSYLNYDFDNHGDADGFACKMHNGKENYFIGCRAWRNCDDAWDLYETDWSVYLINCWAWESGNKSDFANDEFFSDATYLAAKSGVKTISKPKDAGNGNGIKLGGNGAGGSSKGTHYVYNCISFGSDITSSVKGFDENSHGDGVVMRNCLAWDNGYNYMFENGGKKTTFDSCLSFYTGTTGNSYNKPNRLVGECGGSGSTLTNNNFKLDDGDLVMNLTITADDFESIKESDALAPREEDGRLPNNGFGKLKTTSEAYKKQMGIQFGEFAINY